METCVLVRCTHAVTPLSRCHSNVQEMKEPYSQTEGVNKTELDPCLCNSKQLLTSVLTEHSQGKPIQVFSLVKRVPHSILPYLPMYMKTYFNHQVHNYYKIWLHVQAVCV